MMPEPISRPTEVFLPPNSPKRAISAYGLKNKTGRGQTTVSPAPYPVKPRTYLRLAHQVSMGTALSSLRTTSELDPKICNMLHCNDLASSEQLDPAARPHRHDHARSLEHPQQS